MKFCKNFAVLIAAILVVLTLIVLVGTRDKAPRTAGAEMISVQDAEKVESATHSDKALRTSGAEMISAQDAEKGEPATPPKVVAQPDLDREDEGLGEIWRSGKPSLVLPVVRGIHHERQFVRPVTRVLPEVIEKSTPSIMAMIPDDGRQQLLPEKVADHTLKSRRMVLDVQALDRIVNAETNHLRAPTPGNEVLDLKIERILTRAENTHSLMGKISGEEFSDVNIVYHDGIVHGTVARYDLNQHFEYRILEDGYMMVRELDIASMTDVCGNPSADEVHVCGPDCSHTEEEIITVEPVTESGPDVAADTSGWTTIDVVVGYGAQARSDQGGVSQMEAHIIAAVDRMTHAFANSQVTNTELMLLGTIEDPSYVFPGNDSTTMGTSDELGFLNDHVDGILDTVTDYANSLGADLTSFICASGQDGTAGIAYRPGQSSIVSSTSMSSGSMTFSHELGHNLGASHSWGDTTDSDVEVNTSRYGLRFESTGGTRYQTIMAYSGGWGASRIPYFANPNVSFEGTPTGIADGTDLTGNSFVDPRYVSGGAIGTAGAGFNGTNPNLGARNAQMFLVQDGSNGVVFASNHSMRTALGVTSPTSGIQWAAGSSQTISFTGGDMESTADIDLYKGGVYQETLANDVVGINNRFFTWDIPLGQEGGNNYQIRVTLTHMDTSATNFDESDLFVIQGTTDLILEAPLGGEVWTRNTVQHITWSSTYGGNVKIELKKGVAAATTVVESTPDDGSYEWTIPYDLSLDSDYRIIITSDVAPFDSSQSAGDFTLVAPSNTILVATLDTDPGFTTSGEFEYGAPGAGNGASSPYTGINMYDTNLNDTAFDASSLTTYALDCSNHTNITLDFWAYIMVWTDYVVTFEISTDNSNWSELATIGQGETLNQSWTNYTYDITDIAAGEPTVYIRWSMDGSGSQISEGGLSIDDISVTGDFIPADGVSVISPNGGESFIPSIQTRLNWLSAMDGNVTIELLKNGSPVSTIAETTPNDGSYYWTPPASQAVGNDYRIRISSVTDLTRNDESDANFSVVATPTASSIPYSESFETGLGAWSQSGTDDIDWTRNSGGTPSSNTGPSTGSDGSWYLYTEASSNENSTAVLTNWFDLRFTVSPELTFNYHMYGGSMGTLRLEASTDGSTWSTLFEEIGTDEDLWKSPQVDLSAYAGAYVQLKFSGTTGSSWASDMAIDEILIVETAATTYSISYNANASISGNTPSSQTKGQGVDITLADAGTMIRAGYNCIGWNTASDGSGTAYALADTYTSDTGLTLYAQWTFSGYLTWAGDGNPFDEDANNDGFSNGLAWLLGLGQPNADISGYAPVGSSSSGDLIINFESLNAASRGAAALYLEHSNDLGVADPWAGGSVLVPESSGTVGGINFAVTPNGNMNQIEATIPSSEASSGILFGRLRTENP
jgi:hypothetical protein